jgi:drug/metabolite transporter superfamily protein YnfA
MEILKTLGLSMVTALAEIVGCYLPYLWLRAWTKCSRRPLTSWGWR